MSGARPVYGAVGTRDVDIAEQQKVWDSAQTRAEQVALKERHDAFLAIQLEGTDRGRRAQATANANRLTEAINLIHDGDTDDVIEILKSVVDSLRRQG